MARSSTARVRYWAAVSSLTTAAGVIAATGVSHAAAPSGCAPAANGAFACAYDPSAGLVRFVVPAQVTWLDVTAGGGAGGTAFAVPGGKGAQVHNGDVAVDPGDVLLVRAGWSGADSGRAGARGGAGGVQNAGAGGNGGVQGAGGGGGASEVYSRTGSRSLIIAGGGGGAGGDGGGQGVPMFGGPGGDGGIGGRDGSGQHSGEGGAGPSVGINRALTGPAGRAGSDGGAGGGGGGGGAGVGASATGATDALSSGGGGAGGGSFGTGAAQGDSGLSEERDGFIVIRYTPGAPRPAPVAAPAAPTPSPTPTPTTATPTPTPAAVPDSPRPDPQPSATEFCVLRTSTEPATCPSAGQPAAPTLTQPEQR